MLIIKVFAYLCDFCFFTIKHMVVCKLATQKPVQTYCTIDKYLAEKRINNTFKYNHEPLLRVYFLCNDSRSTRTETGILGRQQYMQGRLGRQHRWYQLNHPRGVRKDKDNHLFAISAIKCSEFVKLYLKFLVISLYCGK